MITKLIKQLFCPHSDTTTQYFFGYETLGIKNRVEPFKEICLECDKQWDIKEMEEITL